MAKKLIRLAIILVVVGVLAAWLITMPRSLSAADLPAGHVANLANGEELFTAGNCSGCHKTPGQDDRRVLGGGLKLKSPFGTFVVPNLSSDAKAGIGGWTELEFVNALKRGVGKRGEHLYPAFPYTAYSGMSTSDARDIFAYIKTLPAVATVAPPHELRFPYNIRRSVGGWKLLYFHPQEIVPAAGRSAAWNRGHYLVEAAAHCGECHTPRNKLGGPIESLAYAGAPNLEEGGRFATNITPSKDGIGDWTEEDIAGMLSTGTDKCFNEPIGMRDVLASTQKLTPADNAAIAAYIHALAAKPGNAEHKSC